MRVRVCACACVSERDRIILEDLTFYIVHNAEACEFILCTASKCIEKNQINIYGLLVYIYTTPICMTAQWENVSFFFYKKRMSLGTGMPRKYGLDMANSSVEKGFFPVCR